MNKYIKVAIIIIMTVLGTLMLGNYYQKSNQTNKSLKKLEILKTITMETLDDYLIENPNIIIYVVDSSHDSYYHNNSKFVEFLIKKEVQKDINFLDYNLIEKSAINKMFNKYGLEDIEYKEQDILIFENGKIIDTYFKNYSEFDLENVKLFLSQYGILND